jgi:hypothetical protein
MIQRPIPAPVALLFLLTAVLPANVHPEPAAIHRRDSQVPAPIDSRRDSRGTRAPPLAGHSTVAAHSKGAEQTVDPYPEHDARRHNRKVEILALQVAPLQAVPCEGWSRIRDQ